MCVITVDACRTSAETVRRPSLEFPAPSRLVSELSHVGLFCAVFGYVSLYRHGIWDLFIAESVFIVPALLASVLAIATKGWLLLRRVERRRADAVGAVKERRNRKQMRAALHMLLQRFVLQHEEHAHEELKNANDRGRYEGYGYMLGIVMEARPPSTLQTLLPSHRLTAASIPSRSLLLQDAPFAVVNSLFLVRTAQALATRTARMTPRPSPCCSSSCFQA